MSVFEISSLVRRETRERFADPDTGFNPELAAACSQFGVTIKPVDFGNDSLQFFEANANPALVARSTPSTFPMLFMYSARAASRNMERPSTFSGVVTLGVEVYHSLLNADLPKNLESYVDALESAVIGTMNREEYFSQARWTGNFNLDRPGVVSAGSNWIFAVRAAFDFRLTI